ncbi:MAG TPA: metallophosphoesterase [Candidatus Limnocylindrales bacterium]|nr:metallophosphoesterase [Candidatus Limnocylindrales bacterium]
MAAVDVPPIRIPDGYGVWALTDLHGQLAAVDRLLGRAGITDGGGHWTAPRGTALVITGDCVDRGPDSVGLVRRLVSLRAQAAASGGLVAILEGNHEAQVLGGLAGEPGIFAALMAFGGGATLASAGMAPGSWSGMGADELRATIDALAPDFLPALWTFAPWARWRDVLFVHAGPVPDQPLEQWTRGADRLWIRGDFFASSERFPDAPCWAPYRDAGLGRVVFGHTQVPAPTLTHEGRALNLDTGKGGVITLAGLPADADLARATFLAEPAEAPAILDAPISGEAVRRFDTGLPAVVDAWLERVGEDHPRP